MPREFSSAAKSILHNEILPGYPSKKAALLRTLWLAQEEFGVVDRDAMDAVAQELELAPAHVYGVFSFYTLFRQQGQGRYVLDVCATLPCALRGARDIVHALEEKLGIQAGETTPDGMFTLRKVECLADCDHAPMLQLGERYIRDLTPTSVCELVDSLRAEADAHSPSA